MSINNEFEINGKTGLYALLGSPVSHSISPLMHNASFKALGLNNVYLCFDVSDTNLEETITGLKNIGIKGFNCTYPDKNKMCMLADELSPAAEMIGAVNTVLNDNGRLKGYNTDGTGYMMAVKDAGYDIIGKKMTLLGAGGAASAICVQAAIDGVSEIDVYSIRDQFWDRAVKLIDNINNNTNCKASLFEFNDDVSFRNSVSTSAILTNATSVGLAPDIDNCPVSDTSVFREGLIVSDVIYNPKETKLLSLAKDAGCSIFNGMYMLLYQGAEAFNIWTGMNMPVEYIKKTFFAQK